MHLASDLRDDKHEVLSRACRYMKLDVGRRFRLLIFATELLRRREGGSLASRCIVAVLRAAFLLGASLVAAGLRVSPALVR